VLIALLMCPGYWPERS